MTGFTKEKVREIDRQIGLRIRTLRHKHGISLFRAASYAAVSTQQLQKYETGDNRITAGRLYALCNLLEILVAEFFGDLSLD